MINIMIKKNRKNGRVFKFCLVIVIKIKENDTVKNRKPNNQIY